jgi:hypothetical protein
MRIRGIQVGTSSQIPAYLNTVRFAGLIALRFRHLTKISRETKESVQSQAPKLQFL